MVRKIVGTLVTLSALSTFGLQPPFRGGRPVGRDRASEAVLATPLPALAILPTTGAIVEVNRAVGELFPEHSLLEVALPALFPEQREAVGDAVLAAATEGAATLEVTVGSRAFTLLMSRVAHDQPTFIVLLVPRRSRESAARTAPAEQYPALDFTPRPEQRALDARLTALLTRVVERWPVNGVALYLRRSDDLSLVRGVGNGFDWRTLRLPPPTLATLWRNGKPQWRKHEDGWLYLLPITLPGGESPWGAIAVAPRARSTGCEEATGRLGEHLALMLGQARAVGRGRTLARRVARQRALRDQLMASSHRGILLIDPNGRLEALNPIASSMFNWPPEDVHRRPIKKLLAGLGPLGETLRTALTLPPDSQPRRTTGRYQPPGQVGLKIAVSVEWPRQAPGYALIYLEDTEESAAYLETQHHLDRLAALGKMSGIIAHELRNPLTAILMGIESLAETLGPEHEEADSISKLLDESERVHRIIQDILSISRQPSLTISLCSPRSLMDQVHDTYSRQLGEKQIKVRRYYEPSLPLIEGDSVRLGQMLNNLFGNAIDAVDESGIIEVILRPLSTDQMLARGLNPDQQERLKGGIEIRIKDNGTGIPESELERIFEPLVTTKSTGTGLGLSIVRTIVEQHRGLIFVDSQVGRGTTFTIFLPQLAISGVRTLGE